MKKKNETDRGFWIAALILTVFAAMLAATAIKLYSVDIKAFPANGETDLP